MPKPVHGARMSKARRLRELRDGTDSPGQRRRFIKDQKYTLLARHENLSHEGRQSSELLLKANKRLNTAYLLKESFGQLWDYQIEGWARRFSRTGATPSSGSTSSLTRNLLR